MPLRHYLTGLPSDAKTWVRRLLLAKRRPAPAATALGARRKLAPIADVLARVGREQSPRE